jgi:hypothetical protein
LFINALLKLVATFSSSKVVQRIRFVEAEEVKEVVDVEKMPEKYGGQAGPSPDSREWIRSRIQAFPLPAGSGTMPPVGGGGGGAE